MLTLQTEWVADGFHNRGQECALCIRPRYIPENSVLRGNRVVESHISFTGNAGKHALQKNLKILNLTCIVWYVKAPFYIIY